MVFMWFSFLEICYVFSGITHNIVWYEYPENEGYDDDIIREAQEGEYIGRYIDRTEYVDKYEQSRDYFCHHRRSDILKCAVENANFTFYTLDFFEIMEERHFIL